MGQCSVLQRLLQFGQHFVNLHHPAPAAVVTSILARPRANRIDSPQVPMLLSTALLRGSHEPFRFVQISYMDLER